MTLEVLSNSLDDAVDSARLAGLIRNDRSLASHVFRVVNSGVFRGAREIVALQQAIARLGNRSVDTGICTGNMQQRRGLLSWRTASQRRFFGACSGTVQSGRGLSLGDAKCLLATLGQEAGAALVESWKLPALVGICIYYVGDFAAAGSNADEVATVESRRAVAVAMRQDTLEVEQIIELEAVQHLNLYPEDIEQLLGKAEQIQAALESMVL